MDLSLFFVILLLDISVVNLSTIIFKIIIDRYVPIAVYRVFCFQIFIEKEEDVYNVNSYIYYMESLGMEHITIPSALTNVEGWIFRRKGYGPL